MMSKSSNQDHLSVASIGSLRTTAHNDRLVPAPSLQRLNPTHQYVIPAAGRDLQKAGS